MNVRDLPIARKLSLLLAFNTALAVLVIATVFSIGTAIARYEGAREQLDGMANVIGENSRAALAFNDPQGARQVLAALRAKLEIQRATLTDANGQVFAEMEFSQDRHNETAPLTALIHLLFPDTLTADHVIVEGEVPIGRLRLQAHLSEIWIDLLQGLMMMALIAIALTTLGLQFGLRLHRFLTAPILGLASVSHRVTREQDYAIRATKMGDDEVGSLVDDFNGMLTEIQARDEALRREQASLEERVEQRTAELTQAMEEAERANKVKSEFLSTVSHELRTPLTAIVGSIGLVSGGALGPLPPQISEMLQMALKNGQRLSFLINDLLDMEKLLAGKLHFSLQSLELMPLLEQALEDNRAYAGQFEVGFQITQRLDHVTVNVDPQRLQQVMANLLSNAAKFSHEGGQVELSVYPCDFGVRVEVIDHGTGIPAPLHARVFQKFFQADASDTRQKGGTGLGLAITRELIEHMGGRVGFTSVEGLGSSFFFELPVRAAQPVLPQGVDANGLRKPRVLHIEDDAELHRLVCAMAGTWYAFERATSLDEARARIEQEAFDVVMLDDDLVNEPGRDLMYQIRALQPGARVVILSASPMDPDPSHPWDAVLEKSQLSTAQLIGALGQVQQARATTTTENAP